MAVIERRHGAAATLLARLRSEGMAVRLLSGLDQVAPGDLVLWALPGTRDWDDVRSQLQQYAFSHRIVVAAEGLGAERQLQLLLAGARGYLKHSERWPAWRKALQLVSDGGYAFPPMMLASALDALRSGMNPDRVKPKPADAGPLSPREAQVARRVALGETNLQIAAALAISVSTVKTHLQHIFEKLGVPTRVELALLAARHPERLGGELRRAAGR